MGCRGNSFVGGWGLGLKHLGNSEVSNGGAAVVPTQTSYRVVAPKGCNRNPDTVTRLEVISVMLLSTLMMTCLLNP